MSESKKYLTIEDIEKAEDVRYDEIPAWGGIVRIASLPADEMIAFQEQNEGPKKKEGFARLIAKSMVDAAGNRIGTAKHIEIFKKKDSATVVMVVQRVLKLNNADDLEQQLKDAKNVSGEVPSVASPSTLH